jgi:DNA-binding transcriptional LysR family regulator
MLENMDRLKPFYLVFSQGSVKSAAQILHLTQPAVSQAIQKLEEELHTQLFVRQHKQLIPTSAGKRLFSVVHPFMKDLQTCLDHIDHSREQPFGELRIGAPEEFGKAYLPGIMAAFRKKYPQVTFYLQFGSPENLVGLVGEGKLDLALVDIFEGKNQGLPATCTSNHLFSFEPLARETIILAASRTYFQTAMKEDMSLETLLTQDFIEYTGQRQTIQHWFTHHYGRPRTSFRTVMIVDSHEAVISAIRYHTGLGIVASHLVDQDIQNRTIVPITTLQKDIVNEISLISLQGKALTLTETYFKRFLVEEIGKLGLQGSTGVIAAR